MQRKGMACFTFENEKNTNISERFHSDRDVSNNSAERVFFQFQFRFQFPYIGVFYELKFHKSMFHYAVRKSTDSLRMLGNVIVLRNNIEMYLRIGFC